MRTNNFTFIDLFAGLGGFHIALSQLGGKCVFASELKEDLRKLYVINYPEMEGDTQTGIRKIEGDITKVNLNKIPQHDVLCAGFPCQPFSQAGKQEGFDDKVRGNMFDYICKVITAQAENKPRLLLLENVANLKNHDKGRTWSTIRAKLDELGYKVFEEILSPHQYGYPQHRKRIYIVGIRKEDIADKEDDWKFVFPIEHGKTCDIKEIVNENDVNITPLSLKTHYQLKVWQSFIDELVCRGKEIPSFPIWAMEFGADYPYEEKAPSFMDRESLLGKFGKLGWKINGPSFRDCIQQLPIYAQTDTQETFPSWKIRYIQQNRNFYRDNEEWLKEWVEKIKDWDNSHQKLEWNCGKEEDKALTNKIIQYRASGIRVKLPTYSPALNLVGTQIPILPWVKLPEQCIPHYSEDDLSKYGLTREDISHGRYLSIKEAADLQGMKHLRFDRLSLTRSYEALGNAVNTQVVNKIAKKLIKEYCHE